MSTIEELQQLLEEERTARKEAERKQKEAELKQTQVEELVRRTTLCEYLRACHEHVLSGIVFSVDGYLTSKTPTTNPTRKHCPRLLTPWLDFPQAQAMARMTVNNAIPKDGRLFESVHFLQTIGDRLHSSPVFGEPSLAFVQNNSVEHPVRIILSHLKDCDLGRHGLPAYDKIVFETSATSLRDETDGADTVERDRKLRTDQICVSKRTGEQRNIAYVIEYKAPHKLHTQHLEQGLRAMDIVAEVVSKPTIPTADPERFQHYSELLATAAVTQTYHYMIEAGLEYGYISNGDAFVFLRIDWDNPAVLYYHLSQPIREVKANDDPEVSNAVSQVLAFSALAICSTQKSNDTRVAAAGACQTWKVDFNLMLHKVAALEEEVQGSSTTDRPGKKHRRVPSDPEWTPRPITKKTKQAGISLGGNTSGRVLRPRDRQDSPDADAGGMRGAGAGRTGGAAAGSGSNVAGSSISGFTSGTAPSSDSHSHKSHAEVPGSTEAGNGRPKAYCTPLCLLSLVNGSTLDAKCPNASLHCDNVRSNTKGRVRKHPISYAQWTTLLRQELKQSLDKGVVVLGQEGACGALFQVSLLQYGYTFIAKGGTGRSIPKLQKEHAIYERLRPLQGRNIPVCLGLVDLRELGQVYYYDFDVRIVYFLLLSFGGTPFLAPPAPAMRARLNSMLQATVNEMHRLGVIHGDIDMRNVLRGPNDVPVLIDFDKGRLISVASPPTTLGTASSNKRKRVRSSDDQDDDDMANAVVRSAVETHSALDAETRVRMYEDKANSQCLF